MVMRRGCKKVLIFTICTVFVILSLKYFDVFNYQQQITHNRKILRVMEEGVIDRNTKTGIPKTPIENVEERKDFKSNMDVYIVEEHHAVLKYWFAAAAKGIIPRKGNILVHIDGHADLAMPYFINHFPSFRRPRKIKEIDAMMQTNDAFILGAAISGLISKIVWVWPSWDKPSHMNNIEGEQAYKVGVTTQKIKDSEEYTELFCTCIEDVESSKEECSYIPLGEERDKSIKISRKSCKVRLTIEIYMVRETSAFEFLSSYINDDDSIILDIDEDYYGCTLPAQSLVDKGIPMPRVINLNTLLDDIVCAVNPKQENKGDDILFKVLEILKSKEDCDRIVKNPILCDKKYLRKTAFNFLTSEIEQSNLKCHEHQKLLEKKLVTKLAVFTIPQIEALQKVGFCLTTMPTNISFTESTFQICHGSNVPGETAVLDHPTNSTEIIQRTKILQKILQVLMPFEIPIVTVCRSVRDGYTPREYFRHIENDVLSSLDVLGRIKYLHYDSWLLGGEKGWYSRQDNYDF